MTKYHPLAVESAELEVMDRDWTADEVIIYVIS